MSSDIWVEHLETGERFRVRKVHSYHGSGTLEVLVHMRPYPLRAGRHRLHLEGRKWQIVIPCVSLRNEFYYGPEDLPAPPPSSPGTRRAGRQREASRTHVPPSAGPPGGNEANKH